MKVKIKQQYHKEIVGFGKTPAVPLGQRDDIEELARIALQSKNPTLLRYFEELPDLDELEKKRDQQFLQKTETLVVPKANVNPNKK